MVDLEALRLELRDLTREKKLYKLLKAELTLLGYWQNRPRGNPEKGFKKSNGGKGNISNEL